MQEILETVRRRIRKVAPDATEKISYQMPTFALGGKGTLKFPLGEPVPYDLIEQVVALLVDQRAT